jgi:hypothetical protein
MKGVTQLRGDWGNPKGTGYAKVTVDNLESLDVATALTDMDTFVDALVANGFTECNVGHTGVTDYAIQNADKPAANVNVDDQLVVSFKKGSELKVRRLTIPGCDKDSAVLELVDQGRRLTAAGRTTLEGLIDTLFGWVGADGCIVIEGKHLGKS